MVALEHVKQIVRVYCILPEAAVFGYRIGIGIEVDFDFDVRSCSHIASHKKQVVRLALCIQRHDHRTLCEKHLYHFGRLFHESLHERIRCSHIHSRNRSCSRCSCGLGCSCTRWRCHCHCCGLDPVSVSVHNLVCIRHSSLTVCLPVCWNTDELSSAVQCSVVGCVHGTA
jgi:hypothetical protein